MKFEAEVTVLPEARDVLPRTVQDTATRVVEVGSKALAASLKTFLDEFSEVLSASPRQIGDFTIDEIELALAIGGSGDFRIVHAKSDASITLTLRRVIHEGTAENG